MCSSILSAISINIAQQNTTGGGKMYIPPDEALDRVTSMLGATCTGFTVEFGGDREKEMMPPDAVVELIDLQSLPEHSGAINIKTRQKPSEELQRAQIRKELAMAAYFEAKTEVVKLEKIKLQLEIEKLNE
ncbi:unnamed protein product [Parnassius apollo]|uniref:(apollo) hypothetical protein n=1 Tax=Parnassius apollo TaxID=110799 RepID=A0A8S3WLJ0_PARAO|nr:unnamed protein product [Parnassius apollo]